MKVENDEITIVMNGSPIAKFSVPAAKVESVGDYRFHKEGNSLTVGVRFELMDENRFEMEKVEASEVPPVQTTPSIDPPQDPPVKRTRGPNKKKEEAVAPVVTSKVTLDAPVVPSIQPHENQPTPVVVKDELPPKQITSTVPASPVIISEMAKLIRFYVRANKEKGMKIEDITVEHLKEFAFDIVEARSDADIESAIKEAASLMKA